MLQQVSVNQELLKQAVDLSENHNEAKTLEVALETFIKLKNQAKIKAFRGKLAWEGDLEQMRLDNTQAG